jgi:hypothetical protein
VAIKKGNDITIQTGKNFLVLPFQDSSALTIKSINAIFNTDSSGIDIIKNKKHIDGYFDSNRKNNGVYESVLFEISSFYIAEKSSAIDAFTHLYRCLEYIAYSFPMVYAAKAKDYKGTFKDLKSFFAGDSSTGELKFLKTFIETLFCDEETILKFEFDIALAMNYDFESFVKDFKKIYSGIESLYSIDNNTLSIQFKHFLDFFIITRNRYFHFLAGQGMDNFSSIKYDINEFFASINSFILNWISVIIHKISVYGFYSLPGS